MSQTKSSRRRFLKTAAATAAIAVAAPRVITASKVNAPLIVGGGEHTYEVIHHFPQLPSEFTWQTTHNVAVDNAQNLYVIHEGLSSKKDHPSIFVFDSDGKYIRSFGNQFQGGGHGLEVHEENGQEFLYVTAYKKVKAIAKLDLKGEQLWMFQTPTESGKFREGAADSSRFSFQPTNFAFLPGGGFLVADGYGSYYVHHYDKDGKWLSCFGGSGQGEGTFNLPHGICIDDRNREAPIIVVADRANHTLQRFSLDFKYIDTVTGFGFPANVAIQGNLMLVPELMARVTILGSDNQPMVQLGEDVARLTADTQKKIRQDASQWIDGKFVTPHDACFDAAGNIFVAEYVPNLGRVTKLRKIS